MNLSHVDTSLKIHSL